jgi:hypothetical protein
MSHLLDIPEVAGLDARRGIVRIPPELDVPMTHRVRQILDTPEFRRLARISQLGLVSLVYPAALHTRFEQSLGVVRLALLLLKRLAHDERFAEAIGPEDARRFLVAALLHDLGHWPFCHPIEDICLPACRATSYSPTASCWKAKSPTSCATTGISTRGTSSRC